MLRDVAFGCYAGETITDSKLYIFGDPAIMEMRLLQAGHDEGSDHGNRYALHCIGPSPAR